MPSEYSSVASDDRPFWRKFLVLLLFIPAFGLVVALSFPVTFVASIIENRRKRKLHQQLSASKRCVDWREVKERLPIEGGTIVIETDGPKVAPQLWWTSDDILALAPCAPPENLFLLEPPHGFIEWCNRKYLDDVHGSAVLCLPPYHLSLTSDFGSKIRSEFPKVSVVHIPRYHEATRSFSADNEEQNL